jgi:hypothetical protein
MILFIFNISGSEQFDDAQLKGKNGRSFKRKGTGNANVHIAIGESSQIVRK